MASRRGEPEKIGTILARWLSNQRVSERLKDDGIYRAWREIVGEEIGALTRVVKCVGGVLTVEVGSAPLLEELSTYRRKEILDSIRSWPEFGGIYQIRFRAGGTPSSLGPSPRAGMGKAEPPGRGSVL